MKAVKITLGIVTAFVLVFLITGIVVEEVEYSTKITIDKPVNKVFENFTNPDLIKKWLPNIKSIEVIEQKPAVIGSTYRMTVESNGQEVKMAQKITDFVLNQKITFQFTSSEMIKVDSYNFASNNASTIVTQNSSVNSKSYLTACLYPYFKGTFKAVNMNCLTQLKELSEK
ncbi:SRPBCC domain-containing protein [Tenacibaculum dicentrarchi]|uniref:SRPBCC domain-containing protein n=1 Tax=Tenacibaculum dicentrarchi TaxID=669041 RepID=UPI003518829C